MSSESSVPATGAVPILDAYGRPFPREDREQRASEMIFTTLRDSADFFGGGESDSGVRVTRRSVIGFPPMWRGVNLLSSDVAKLPCRIYRKIDPTGKERDVAHPAYRLVRRKANEELTAFTFWQQFVADAIWRGNGYAYIVRDGAGRPRELWPLLPEDVTPCRFEGQKYYIYNLVDHDGRVKERKLLPENVLHLRGLGEDTLCGYDLLSIAKDALGGAMAPAKFGRRYYKNGTAVGTVIEFPGPIDEEKAKKYAKTFDAMHAGLENAHKTAVLGKGGKATVMQADAKKAQLLEARQFEAREVANLLQIPPRKLGVSDSAYPSSNEADNQQYLNEALDQWLCRCESEVWDKLLTEEEKRSESHSVRFERKALLRADMSTRGAFYSSALQNRWMTPDEVRGLEDLNPLPDGAGAQVLPAPNASLPAPSDDGPDDPDDPEDPTDPDPDDDSEERRRVARNCLDRLAKRINTRATRMSKLPAEKWRSWLALLAHEQEEFVRDSMLPTLRLAARKDCSAIVGQMVEWMRMRLEENREATDWIEQAAPVVFLDRLF